MVYIILDGNPGGDHSQAVFPFAVHRARLSMDRPGKLQQSFEVIYDFLHEQSEANAGHDGPKYLSLFGTIFILVLFCNLIGIIPTLESPTMFPEVPAGLALVVFCYYNLMGMLAQGAGRYLLHFAGPIWWMAAADDPDRDCQPSGSAACSLTIRLFANMYAGERVTGVFLGLTYLIAPAVFMGLHVFASILAGLYLRAYDHDVRWQRRGA